MKFFGQRSFKDSPTIIPISAAATVVVAAAVATSTGLADRAASMVAIAGMEKYAEPQMNSQEMWYRASSASSSVTTTTRNEGSLHASLSPVFLSNKKISPKTVGHPNALKNIKNPTTLLQASIGDIINPNEGRVLPHYLRSLSTIDFRSLDPEKISQLLDSTKIRPSRTTLFNPVISVILSCFIYRFPLSFISLWS